MEEISFWALYILVALHAFHNAYMHGQTEKALLDIKRKLNLPIEE